VTAPTPTGSTRSRTAATPTTVITASAGRYAAEANWSASTAIVADASGVYIAESMAPGIPPAAM